MTRLQLFPVFLAAVLTACSASVYAPERRTPLPRIGVSISPDARIRDEIDALLPDSLFPPANISILIVSLGSGDTLYALNPDLLFHPASNQKIFTSAAALSVLGPSHRFVTEAFIDTLDEPTLTIRGGGDPMLSTGDLDSLVVSLIPLMRGKTGWLLRADISYFDSVAYGEGWAWDEFTDPTIMEVAPLSVNGNTISVSVTPASAPGKPVLVSITPPTGFVQIQNNAITVGADVADSLTLRLAWSNGQNTVSVSGTIKQGSSIRKETFAIRRPALYALTLLSERLMQEGILIETRGVSAVPGRGKPVARRERSLDSVLVFMNKESDNLCAENLLKVMGAESSGAPGTFPKGITSVRRFLAASGIDTLTTVIADGSGVSRYNLSSTSAIVTLLRQAHRSPWAGLFEASLPIAGVDGTLRRRMNDERGRGNIRAKTGTLRDVSALSGYVTTADGEPLAFSILIQHFPQNRSAYRKVQDSLALYLSRLHRHTF
jgi:D-alanyl-D-alanine carboxypeptidase/D-alanyl-D-alanine-endopeptidase (penicillin-binding protein 4)